MVLLVEQNTKPSFLAEACCATDHLTSHIPKTTGMRLALGPATASYPVKENSIFQQHSFRPTGKQNKDMPDEFTSLHFSEEFVIGCGTVSIDLAKDLVLLLYCRKRRQYHLPKGRKNVGESLEDAAIRETFEESGHKCHYNVSHAHKEPLAVQQRRGSGPHRIIFWYLASADSTELPVVGTQEAWEDFEPHWLPLHEAAAKLAREDDQQVVPRAVQAVLDLKKKKGNLEN
ncbi:NUDIX domain-containing protein [Blastomyces dermatitidis ATCC 18188]|uniref:NUDIX domain-containing protein n=2 Tax=Ajellomyces dermatitidis TaxID=5039 RepID=F2T7G0_AJEDA|nr:NUDIX domain-containing protein [Blastomyces dermatitidis ATCC 18188]